MTSKIATTATNDLVELHETVHGLIGKKCWGVWLGYGDELHLDFGAHIPYTNAKLAGKTHGSWRFATCGTAWEIVTPRGRLSSTLENANVIESSRVTDFRVRGIILTITFSNYCRFRVVPTADDDQYDIPYRELLMPRHRIVSFGPGKVWSCERSDLPCLEKDVK